ncbi:HAD family hydrolase [Actinoalloteichus sp. GBA129-24]|uniref:HAD family hydrolase n=1 Tax=Actinoalloteichus sp. GBA129-24 TaxID=1612551 RepID=UPI000950AC20|nr:HAD-IA family hydrolase [Actinoalloteichus sp. GBA129-24]APU22163.1 beta-phosphoglucomutase hydrolase [Actinoalloteichus sp. GBA129-24]
MTGIDVRRVDAALFDLDGVVTDTARVHAAAWQRLFDDFLTARPAAPGEDHRPFSTQDYLRKVDGRPREDGARAFLRSRGIRLPEDRPESEGSRATEDGRADEPETLRGLARRKDAHFQAALAQGVHAYPDACRLLTTLRGCGLRTAVVSASRNCAAVLARAGIDGLFDTRVDGVLAARRGLPGKPAPAAFLAAAELLGVAPARAVVLEDAETGVIAGRRGEFALVVGVDRTGDGSRLREAGAHVVVTDLDGLAVTGCPAADRAASGPEDRQGGPTEPQPPGGLGSRERPGRSGVDGSTATAAGAGPGRARLGSATGRRRP